MLVIDPTHKDGDRLSEKLRELRKDKGLIGGEETDLPPAGGAGLDRGRRKAMPGTMRGDEVDPVLPQLRAVQGGRPGEGQRAAAAVGDASSRSISRSMQSGRVKLAQGDTVRITANGWDVTGKHRIDNGRIDEIAGFTPGGEPVLSNGWVLAKDFAHIKHGLVSTSPASQSKTFDIVLAAMNRASLGAMGAAQGYVTVSRGRERGMIFTDMTARGIARGDPAAGRAASRRPN